MGILSKLFKSAPTHDDSNIIIPTAIDPNELSEKKKAKDLERLMEFDKTLKSKKKVTDTYNEDDISNEDISLQLKNPFRGV